MLSELLPENVAGDWLNEQVGLVMVQDRLPAAAAWRVVSEGVRTGDPVILAAPGQVWQLREEFDSLAPWPIARRIEVQVRLYAPGRVQVTVETGVQHWLPLHALRMFELVEWRWLR
jgi:hypothetical protein